MQMYFGVPVGIVRHVPTDRGWRQLLARAPAACRVNQILMDMLLLLRCCIERWSPPGVLHCVCDAAKLALPAGGLGLWDNSLLAPPLHHAFFERVLAAVTKGVLSCAGTKCSPTTVVLYIQGGASSAPVGAGGDNESLTRFVDQCCSVCTPSMQAVSVYMGSTFDTPLSSVNPLACAVFRVVSIRRRCP
ncbi:unnamed protein product [Ostreobium quekettii]|uniref:Uncharacterized protein n=1 Tax=Ostreobium quekettii TaxID=121088 RepID=A0A8S1JAD9_9CHLO|nr:unnamed protein product [Ostreobium quekettii]